MKKVKFLNWLLVLFVVFTSFNLASCSDDDNYVGGGDGDELPDGNPNPAGDDFYAYVNGAWHKTLEETGETQGYVYDIAQVLADKTAECADNMPELPFVLEAFEKYSAEENEARLDEIISDIIDDIETEEDAYLAIGECVKMGLIDDYIRLYMTPRGSEVGFTLVPKSQADEMDMNDVEEEEDDDEMSPEDEVVEIIIEGMGASQQTAGGGIDLRIGLAVGEHIACGQYVKIGEDPCLGEVIHGGLLAGGGGQGNGVAIFLQEF